MEMRRGCQAGKLKWNYAQQLSMNQFSLQGRRSYIYLPKQIPRLNKDHPTK